VLDDVQYCRREFQNRTFIVPLLGTDYWCTLAVSLPHGRTTMIKDVLFDKMKSIQTIESTIKYSFRGDTHSKQVFSCILDRLKSCDSGFVDFVVASAVSLLNLSGAFPKIIRSSELNDSTEGKTEKLISLCKKVGGDTYISDSGGARYLDEGLFIQNNIKLIWHVWEKPTFHSVQILEERIRNGSGLNVLARSEQGFIDSVLQCKVSRKKLYAEGK
jgi:hypothetical protein